MTIDEWRRELLVLSQAVSAARAAFRDNMLPLEGERAYAALVAAETALEEHYLVRPIA